MDSNALIPSAAGAGTPPGPEQQSVAPPNAMPAGAQQLAMPGASQAGDVLNYMKSQMNQTAAKYDRLKEITGKTTVLRETMDQLGNLGDMVTQNDVTKAASKLVAAGFGSEEIAGILADMPADGEALQAWIGQHEAALAQHEAALQQMTAVTRHQLGVQALHHIGAVSMVQHGLANAQPMGQPPAAPGGNALTGGPNG